VIATPSEIVPGIGFFGGRLFLGVTLHHQDGCFWGSCPRKVAKKQVIIAKKVVWTMGSTLGRAHTCALLSDETVQCWGYNHYGQLGDGHAGYYTTPQTVVGIP
jgi:hypothetical protein